MTSITVTRAGGRRPRRRPALAEAASPIIMILLLIGVGHLWLDVPADVLMILAAGYAGVLAWWLGRSWTDIETAVKDRIRDGMPAMLIMLSVGLVIGTWMASGTIPMIVSWGLQLINPNWLVPIAFLVTTVVSTLIGTSYGSVGTVGVALIGVAASQGVSLPMTAGAIIAGAYFGDKMSPLSDTTNMASATAGVPLFDHIKHLLYTTVPAAVVSLIVYVLVSVTGLSSGDGTGDSGPKDAILQTLEQQFHLNPILLLPVAVVLFGALLKKPALPVMILSALVAFVLAVVFQGFSLEEVGTAASKGFDTSMLIAHGASPDLFGDSLDGLLNRGGLSSMATPFFMGLAAFAFAGVLIETECLDVLMTKLLHRVRRVGSLILATTVGSLVAAFVTATSYLTILITGETFKKEYPKRGLAMKNLSRTLEDSGTVFVPLLPWSEAGVFMAGTLGVANLDFAPWAVLCYVSAIFAIICGYTGIGIAREPAPASDNNELVNK